MDNIKKEHPVLKARERFVVCNELADPKENEIWMKTLDTPSSAAIAACGYSWPRRGRPGSRHHERRTR